MTTLEFPDIAAPAEQPRTDLATAASTALDLEKLDLTTLALARFGNWRADVAAVNANLTTLALDLGTAAKCKEARSLRQRLIGDRMTEARKVAQGIKSKMAATSKVVGAELDAIEGAYQQADTLILPKIEAREAELEAEREAARQAEAARVAKHQAGIANIRAYAERCRQPGMTSERIANGIAQLAALTFTEGWEEFAVQAANAQCETLEAMRVLQAQALAREQEAARLELQRQETERAQRELEAERQRIAAEDEAIRKQAAEADRLMAEARALLEKAQAPAITGTPEGHLAQDLDRGLSEALASKPDAMLHAREAATAIAAERITPDEPDAAPHTVEVPEQPDRDHALTQMEQQPASGGSYLPPSAPALPPATITIGQINDRLAPLKLDAAGLQALGFARQQRPGPAAHFLASDWELVKAAIVKHVQGLV